MLEMLESIGPGIAPTAAVKRVCSSRPGRHFNIYETHSRSPVSGLPSNMACRRRAAANGRRPALRGGFSLLPWVIDYHMVTSIVWKCE